MQTMTTVKMSFEEWVESYKPELDEHGEVKLYETYGKDLDKAFSYHQRKPLHIWTWIEGDEEDNVIVDGYHTVDRCGFFITRKPARGNETYEIDYN